MRVIRLLYSLSFPVFALASENPLFDLSSAPAVVNKPGIIQFPIVTIPGNNETSTLRYSKRSSGTPTDYPEILTNGGYYYAINCTAF